MKERILLVEDDLSLGSMLVEGLKYEGFSVDWVKDGFSAIKKVMEEEYDVVLLDLMLPKMDGLKVCKTIRQTKDIPIVVITAKSQIEDKVEVLNAGADDYITKPFSFKELYARIRAVLRRYSKNNKDHIKVGDLFIDLSSAQVIYRGERINLTRREFELLKLLAENPNTVLSREKIYSRIWGSGHEEGSNIVDVYIKNLRRKLKDENHQLIQTVRGFGYMLKSNDS
ncbi:response regulator transcription factor [Thermocrinis minervae]|uniref:Two-component system, OmpR family, response regulator ArlR n=1 Tax=Thermocrinis minervae TaxID=381751 RepID=A0A1M6RA71_9AQUI|nr:response regulator transcription factor [Thermocrinis minervae]SHK29354.1 two-component system, OmpR family, response regulator ArlR [Thermocrinis minervae]